jgi:SAM-dependent methyltransferase
LETKPKHIKTCNSFINCKEERKNLFWVNGYEVIQCKQCDHRYTKISNVAEHVDKVYSDTYFFEGGDGYPDYLKEKDILYKCGLRYARLISKYIKPSDVLDVGSAAGFILKGFKEKGWNCWGIEPNDTMAEYGRKELGLNIITGSLESFQSDRKFDLINLIQVIGHFYDLDAALQNVHRLLNRNGLVLVESWDMKSFAASIIGKNWHEYCPPSVINWFSDKTLTQLFNYYGFELVDKGRPVKKININHGLSLFDESFPKFPFKKLLLKFFSRTIGKYNVRYPPIDLKWYIFRKLE